MSQELHYTSVARGLKPGARGFCTVASTVGLSPTLAERLEGLSGYRANFPADHPQAARNPVAWSHLRINSGGQTVSVVSRIGPAGLDYTDRPNKYAHHVVLDAAERHAGGPGWLLEQPGFMVSEWLDAPQQITTGRSPATGDQPGGICRAWAKMTGDAGWGGVLAEAFLADPKRQAVVVFDPGTDVLRLFVEALALLPADRRWEVTFQTYFTGLPPGVTCLWRGVVRDSAEARQARGNPDALLIDLAETSQAVGGSLVHWAKTGEAPAAITSPIPQSPDRSPSYVPPPPPAVAPSSRRVTRPVASAPAEPALHDPYTLGPPPAPVTDGRLRETRTRKYRAVGSSSPWPIIVASAIAFILGTSLGGTGVYLMMQARGQRSGVAQTVAETKKTGDTAVLKVSPNTDESLIPGVQSEPKLSIGNPPVEKSEKGKTVSPGSVTQGIGEPRVKGLQESEKSKPQAPASASGMPAENKNMSVNPGGSGVAATEKLPPRPGDPSLVSDGQGNRPSHGDTKPKPAFSETEPLPMNIWVIASDPGNENPQFIAAGKVKGLSLFGGDDDRWGNYRFKGKPDASKNTLEVQGNIYSSGEDLGTIGVFSWDGNKTVKFKWDGKSPTSQLKAAFQNCILAVEYEDKPSEYRLLRDPKFMAQPKLNKKMSKTGIQVVDWLEKSYDDDWKNHAQRIPSLYALTVYLPGDKAVAFSGPHTPKNPKDGPIFTSEGGHFDARLTKNEPPQISVTMNITEKPLPDAEHKAYLSRRDFINKLPPDANPAIQVELTQLNKLLDSQNNLKKRLNNFTKASIEATIVFEVGGKKFLLAKPRLEQGK